MGLLELCLLPLLSPQEPAANGSPVTPAAAVAAPAPDPDVLALLAAERLGANADVTVLATLASSKNETVAARAAWLLGRTKDQQTEALCGEVATKSPHAEARLQAMYALRNHGDTSAVTAGLQGLLDSDRRVRTIAAQLLGRLRRPTAVEPLLALLDRSRTDRPGSATDLQAALLALHDLGAAEHLLRAATAIHDGKATGTGEALAFCFQDLSPQLERKQEITTLLAVLDHKEPLLRRFAIGRLAELGDPTTAPALQARLNQETELRPLVEVALVQLRGDEQEPSTDELERALTNVRHLAARAATRWAALTEMERWIGGTVPVALLVLLLVTIRMRRRHAAAAAAAATAALVAPSDEYLEEMNAEAEALAEQTEAFEAATETFAEEGSPDAAEVDADAAATATDDEYAAVADQADADQADDGVLHR